MTSPIKISSEVAQDQLDIMIDYYEIDIDIMSESIRENVAFALEKIKQAIKKGRVEITNDKDLKIIQKLKTPINDVTEIVYGPATAKSKLQIKDKDDQYKKVYKLMASVSGEQSASIFKLSLVDASILECLGLVFLQV